MEGCTLHHRTHPHVRSCLLVNIWMCYCVCLFPAKNSAFVQSLSLVVQRLQAVFNTVNFTMKEHLDLLDVFYGILKTVLWILCLSTLKSITWCPQSPWVPRLATQLAHHGTMNSPRHHPESRNNRRRIEKYVVCTFRMTSSSRHTVNKTYIFICKFVEHMYYRTIALNIDTWI